MLPARKCKGHSICGSLAMCESWCRMVPKWGAQGLRADAKGVTLEDRLLEASPFDVFAQSKLRERDRDIQFMTAGGAVASHSCIADRKTSCHRIHPLKFMYHMLCSADRRHSACLRTSSSCVRYCFR